MNNVIVINKKCFQCHKVKNIFDGKLVMTAFFYCNACMNLYKEMQEVVKMMDEE